ncbi:MAG: endonuclease [Ignavibacteriae bacterium]|nr:MAG: endonuclease [Ignavibacteriota bacterium]
MEKNILILTVLLVISIIIGNSNSIVFAQSTPTKLKAMTFNIRYDNPDDGINNWHNRKTSLINLIKQKNADILGLQEVLHHQKEFIDSSLSEYSSFGIGREDGKAKGEYAPIYFKKNKFSIIDSGTFWLSETPDSIASVGWDAALERIATWLILKEKATGRKLFVLNTHFDHQGKTARLESVKLITAKLTELSKDLHVIIMGDFNFINKSLPYNYMVNNDVFDLYDTMEISNFLSDGLVWTFNGFDNNISPKEKIDYIFVGKKIKVSKHLILFDKHNGNFISDHFPVLVEIIL